MSFRQRYKIEQRDIRRLEEIAQTDGNLQVLRMNPDWAALLEKKANLKEAVSSIGIEGTVLTIDQAEAITGGDVKGIGDKERREFIGYYQSLQLIKELVDKPLTRASILRIHERVTHGDSAAQPGRIRGDQRSVRADGKIIYTAPPATHLGFLTEEFIKWFNKAADDKQLSPIIAAAICHFWFVWIHPFCDGNGRVARLLTTLLLLKKHAEGIRYFALSDYYNRHKDRYYAALKKTNVCDPNVPSMNFTRDLSPWLSFFIDSYLARVGEIREVTNRILQLNIRVEHLRRDGLITERHNKALSILYSRDKASYQELKTELGVSRPRVHQILKPLRDAHILLEEKIGQEKWFKLGSPENEPDETVFKRKLKRRTGDNSRKEIGKVSQQQALPIFPRE
jgi:Fic family protein